MKIGLDIDGVLAKFAEHYLEYLNFEDKSLPTDWHDMRFKEHFQQIAFDSDFWLSIPPAIDPNILDFIPVIYVTARPIDSTVTSLWLEKNGFPYAPVITVGHNGSKVRALKNRVDVFVDDAYHNYMELNEAGINCVLMSQSHNEQFDVDKRIHSINQVLNYE